MTTAELSKTRQAKKEAILKTATQVFSEEGFLNVNMQRIINACGISRGGIYLYFQSVDELFIEVIRSRSVRQFDLIRQELKDKPDFDKVLTDYLTDHKKRLLGLSQGKPSLLRAMYEYSFTHNTEADRRLKQKQVNATRATVQSLLNLGAEQGKLASDQVRLLAEELMLLIEGMNVLALTGELQEIQIDRQFQQFERQFDLIN
ncbi:TetR/AcrR family transcriptional regulator [Fructobacillus durionis]|uniref:Transcriptional regulator, TetR family n=1 Tax=Fructobacillus durionis TaxID=283737 RepID=A0A1I1GYM3_9LACO|nr:TetR/AcrR family transcriptional regulator [Fructobacillus durionis]SFC14050.1 transcriptional regulator, TetR family [Fructobacillus durionis]